MWQEDPAEGIRGLQWEPCLYLQVWAGLRFHTSVCILCMNLDLNCWVCTCSQCGYSEVTQNSEQARINFWVLFFSWLSSQYLVSSAGVLLIATLHHSKVEAVSSFCRGVLRWKLPFSRSLDTMEFFSGFFSGIISECHMYALIIVWSFRLSARVLAFTKWIFHCFWGFLWVLLQVWVLWGLLTPT